MATYSYADPSPFFLSGGTTGVLLIHGFTGSPAEMRYLGEFLHAQGLTAAAPLLPGHGTTYEDLNRRRWTEWAGCVDAALADLRRRCRTVFVAGLSLGSLLTLHLAAAHPELPGIILYSPAPWVKNRQLVLTPFAQYFVKSRPQPEEADLFDAEAVRSLWFYDVYPVPAAAQLLQLMRRVRVELSRVTCPALVLYSTCDGSIHPTSAQRTYDGLGSRDKRIVAFHECGHCMTVDREREAVAARTYDFVQAHGG